MMLARLQALPEERIMGVETGGCPHTAIREDASINLQAIAELNRKFPDLDIVFIESGGDNLAATFSPDLADLTLYVISVCQGEEIPRKGGPGITRSDFLVINKSDLAPYVNVDLDVMERDAAPMRGKRPFGFTDLSRGKGLPEIVDFIVENGGSRLAPAAAKPPEHRVRTNAVAALTARPAFFHIQGEPEVNAMTIARLSQGHPARNLPFYEERVDLACAFRWTARLNMHEAVANHFSLAVNDDGSQFLMNPNQVHFSRIKASDLLLIDANDPETMSRPERARPDRLGPARRHPPQLPPCALRHACAFDPCHGACLARRFHAAADRPEFGDVLQPPRRRRPLWRARLRGRGRALLEASRRPQGQGHGDGQPRRAGDRRQRRRHLQPLYYFERACETYIKALWTGRPLRVLSDEIAEKTASETDDYPGQAERHLAELKAILDEQEPAYRN